MSTDEHKTRLAKIESVQYGPVRDREYLFGLSLTFVGDGWGVGSCSEYAINLSEHASDDTIQKQQCLDVMKKTRDLLADAKVDSVEKLVGAPVEITFKGNALASFRILTEVL